MHELALVIIKWNVYVIPLARRQNMNGMVRGLFSTFSPSLDAQNARSKRFNTSINTRVAPDVHQLDVLLARKSVALK